MMDALQEESIELDFQKTDVLTERRLGENNGVSSRRRRRRTRKKSRRLQKGRLNKHMKSHLAAKKAKKAKTPKGNFLYAASRFCKSYSAKKAKTPKGKKGKKAKKAKGAFCTG